MKGKYPRWEIGRTGNRKNIIRKERDRNWGQNWRGKRQRKGT